MPTTIPLPTNPVNTKHTIDTDPTTPYHTHMKPAPTPIDPPIRKSITLPQSLWAEIEDYRFPNRIPSDAEAIRRLLRVGLDGAQGK